MKRLDVVRIKHEAIERDRTCQQCGCPDNLIAHHIIPKNVGGEDELNNLVALCRKCHKKVHRSMGQGMMNSTQKGISKSSNGHQIWIDEDAKRILDKEKEELKKIGRSGASLGDAIRSLRDGGHLSADH